MGNDKECTRDMFLSVASYLEKASYDCKNFILFNNNYTKIIQSTFNT